MADIAVTVALFLVERVLSSLALKEWKNLHKNVRDGVENVKTSLKTMKAYLRDMEGNEGDSEVLRDRIQQVRDVAYFIEDFLDELMLHAPRRLHTHEIFNTVHGYFHDVKHWKTLHEMMPSKMEEIKGKISGIADLDSVRAGLKVTLSEEGGSSVLEHDHHIVEDDEILGFEEPREALIRQLTESRRLTISVVGPGGSGKTILVKNVYDSKEVKGHFDCHAWVRVSRSSFKINELVCSMLNQFCAATRGRRTSREGAHPMSELRNYLQRKRYVLVLDDVWSTEHWERIKNVLPDGSRGSKIIVTTRNTDVASSCVDHFVHTLKPLSRLEAWGLFCKKAFQTNDGKCPPELVEWAHKFVDICDGLPLAIVAVGGLLSKTQQFPNEWKKLHDSIGSEIETHSNLSIISRVLLPSYKDLPSNLRTCFLYLSIFPEDYSIKRARLIRLWVAEGFVKKKKGKTLEEVAEDYLNQLIGRNLVHASKWDFDGRVRSCRVLNLVREFLVTKSENENFVSILLEPDSSSSEKVRRLSIHNACTTLSKINDFSHVRSAFLFRWDNFCPSVIGNMLHSFRLLRVLDLQDAPLDKFPEDIVRLTLLRYLSLRNTNIKTVPESIKKLSYLETLDLKQTRVTKLPEKILLLHCLRHLLVYRYDVVKNYVTFDSARGVGLSPGIAGLTNLQKLSLVKLDKHRKIIKDLAALTQLRKLGLIDLKSEDGKDLCESIQKMKNLLTLSVRSTSEEVCLDLDHMGHGPPPHLQRLYLKGQIQKLPGWISSLNDLVRIGLKWSKLQHSPLEALQQLPNLMELQMLDAFTGYELVFEAGRFKKLKILYIEQFDGLNKVVVQQGATSELQKLTLGKCVNLKKLPLGINYLTHLKELILYDMPNEFISLLEKKSKDRKMVSHIHLIHSFTLGSNQLWSLQNLS